MFYRSWLASNLWRNGPDGQLPVQVHFICHTGTYAPRSGSLWLSDVSHHHLALGISSVPTLQVL